MKSIEKNNNKEDSYLAKLKTEGADLLISDPSEGTPEHARLGRIDAKIEQLTSPITTGVWIDPEDWPEAYQK